MFDRSVTICEIFAVKMCMTLTVTFKIGQGQMLKCQSKGHIRLLCVDNSNVYPICHHLRDISSQNVHDPDPDF